MTPEGKGNKFSGLKGKEKEVEIMCGLCVVKLLSTYKKLVKDFDGIKVHAV